MITAARLLAETIGRVSPKYRTLDQWAVIYRQIVESRPICEKTKSNRRSSLAHLLAALGDRTISAVRPHEVAAMVRQLHSLHQQSAKRLLIEAKDMFNEAMNYGWIDRNPAASVKAPLVKVQRNRLTIDQWRKIQQYAQDHQPPWVSRLLMLSLVTGQRRSDVVKMRFSDVWDGYLHVEQAKTGERIAIPVALRLAAIGVTVGDVIESCRSYAVGTEYLLRKHNGQPLCDASLSARFEEAIDHAVEHCKTGGQPSLHECRSLAERLYRAQGINTMVLLGHKHQSMTDLYNDDRGLSRGEWKTLQL